MAYVTSILRPDERVLAIGRMHWIIYKEAAIVLLLAIVCFVIANDYQRSHRQVAPLVELAGLFFLAAAVLFGIKAWFTQWITEIAVTNLRVIYKRGFIKRYTAEMNMDKIESVTVTQSILGRMLDYGSVHVRGTGVGIEHLHQIRAPIMLRNCITAR